LALPTISWEGWCIMGNKFRKYFSVIALALGPPVVAIIFALGVGAILIASVGVNPFLAYQSLLKGAFGSVKSFTEVLVKVYPLLLAGLGVCIAFSAGAISVGAEGQILIGGLATAFVGVYFASLPPIILIPLCVLAAFAAGAVWGIIPGYLFARKGLSVVINTIMLNYIALYLVNYFINGPFRDASGAYPQSPVMGENGWWIPLIPKTRLHLGLIIAFLAVIVVYFLMWHTPLGVKIKAVGFNQSASRFAGIQVEKTIVIALAISGGLAGLAGAGEIAGIHHRILPGFSSNYGWDAIAVALLGRLHPLGIVLSSLFWGALRVGANNMQRVTQIPVSLVVTIQALAIFFVLVSELWSSIQKTHNPNSLFNKFRSVLNHKQAG
jgi:ABC-type uncharacterized transport system permease subunit